MTRLSIALLLVIGLPISASALAAGLPPITPNSRITFSFADPAPGKQLIAIAGTKGTNGAFSYDPESPINFIVGSNDGSVPTTVFENVYVEMDLEVLSVGIPRGGPSSVFGTVAGSFTIYALTRRGRADILHADLPVVAENDGPVVAGGQLFLVGPIPQGPLTGAIISSSAAHTLDYAAGPLLTEILDPLGIALAPLFDAVFTITDLSGFGPGQPRGGSGGPPVALGNASFSGTAALIPTPGTTSLLAVAGLVSLRRRR